MQMSSFFSALACVTPNVVCDKHAYHHCHRYRYCYCYCRCHCRWHGDHLLCLCRYSPIDEDATLLVP